MRSLNLRIACLLGLWIGQPVRCLQSSLLCTCVIVWPYASVKALAFLLNVPSYFLRRLLIGALGNAEVHGWVERLQLNR